MALLWFLLGKVLVTARIPPLTPSTPPLPTQVLRLKAILDLVKARLSQEPRDSGRCGLSCFTKRLTSSDHGCGSLAWRKKEPL